MYAAALDAALGLVGKVPAARVGLALGSEEGMTVVASAGVDAAKIVGDPLNLDALSAPSRSRFLGKHPVEVEDEDLADVSGALGLIVRTRPFFLVPLFFQEEIKGALGVTTDAPSPPRSRTASSRSPPWSRWRWRAPPSRRTCTVAGAKSASAP